MDRKFIYRLKDKIALNLSLTTFSINLIFKFQIEYYDFYSHSDIRVVKIDLMMYENNSWR